MSKIIGTLDRLATRQLLRLVHHRLVLRDWLTREPLHLVELMVFKVPKLSDLSRLKPLKPISDSETFLNFSLVKYQNDFALFPTMHVRFLPAKLLEGLTEVVNTLVKFTRVNALDFELEMFRRLKIQVFDRFAFQFTEVLKTRALLLIVDVQI
jgi:hypothetical protein